MIFTFAPDYGPTLTETPNIREATFGDGYAQRQAFGINPVTQVWNLSFNGRTDAEGDSILLFFRSLGGVQNFQWTPPGSSVQKNFICKTWGYSVNQPLRKSVTATFTEVHDL